MKTALAYGSAMGAIVRRDASVYASYRLRLITSNLGIVFSLALYYYIAQLVNVPPFDQPGEYFAFVVVGIVIFGVVRSSLAIPEKVHTELLGGTYERLVLSPFGGTAAIVAMMLFPLIYSLAVATFTLAVAAIFFGVHVQWSTAALAAPIGVFGAFSFAPFALLFAASTLAFKQSPGQGVILAVVSIVSGLYFPVELLPSWISWASKVQPFTPAVDLMRHVLVGLPLRGSATMDVLKLVVFAFVFLPITVFILTAAGRYSRRRGTIIEY